MNMNGVCSSAMFKEARRCFEYSLTGCLWKDAPVLNGSSAFEILATGKCSRALKMLSTERFEGGMHRCSLRPAQRMHEINPRNVTKNESNYAGQISTSVLIVQVVGSPSYCKLQRSATYCNVLQRIATCFYTLAPLTLGFLASQNLAKLQSCLQANVSWLRDGTNVFSNRQSQVGKESVNKMGNPVAERPGYSWPSAYLSPYECLKLLDSRCLPSLFW